MRFLYLLLLMLVFSCSSNKRIEEINSVVIPSQLAINANKDVGISVGDVAPEIQLPNLNGELISLSDFRGKYVLIDFWAAWCGPCRAENPNNVKLYQRYKEQGFEIFGVSLDRDNNAWKAAVKYDKLSWPQVSDLKWWQSEVVPLYQIQGIPHTVLLDKEGKIIAKNLRGVYLAAKLQQIFELK